MTLEINSGNSGFAPENMKAIPEDVYELELIDRTEPQLVPAFTQPADAKPGDPPKMQLRFRLDFQIVDHVPGRGQEDLNGQRVGDMFTVSLHEKSRLRPFVRAMVGSDELGDKFDLDTLIASKNGGVGGRLRATIARKPNNYYEVKNPLVSKTMPPEAFDAEAAAAGTVGAGEPPF
jgi:hypothetical protein